MENNIILDLLNDSEVDKPKEWIIQATLMLIEDKSFDDISVTDIIDKAGISRRTFYNHFQSKQDILEQVSTQAINFLFQKAFKNVSNEEELIRSFINIMYTHKTTLLNIYSEKTAVVLKKLIQLTVTYIVKSKDTTQLDAIDIDNEVLEIYLLNLLSSILETVVSRGFKETEEQIYIIISRLFLKS